jgi:hypothetical protein
MKPTGSSTFPDVSFLNSENTNAATLVGDMAFSMASPSHSSATGRKIGASAFFRNLDSTDSAGL